MYETYFKGYTLYVIHNTPTHTKSTNKMISSIVDASKHLKNGATAKYIFIFPISRPKLEVAVLGMSGYLISGVRQASAV